MSIITLYYKIIITLLLRHYYVVLTSPLQMAKLCNNYFIITYYYIWCFNYLPIITIITYYYAFETGQLADAGDPIFPQLCSDLMLYMAHNSAGCCSMLYMSSKHNNRPRSTSNICSIPYIFCMFCILRGAQTPRRLSASRDEAENRTGHPGYPAVQLRPSSHQ